MHLISSSTVLEQRDRDKGFRSKPSETGSIFILGRFRNQEFGTAMPVAGFFTVTITRSKKVGFREYYEKLG